jgi:uncharacterized protein YegL
VTAPEVLPVYLVLPSRPSDRPDGTGGLTTAADFVDALALHPTTGERVLLGVIEYSDFANELAPLCDRLDAASRVNVSGFDGLDFAAVLTSLAAQLDYDRFRFAQRDSRIGRPVVVLIVDAEPADGEDWREAHDALVRAGDDTSTAPVVVAVATDSALLPFAEAMSFPSRYGCAVANGAAAGELAASVAIRILERGGIGMTCEPHDGLPTKGRLQ